MDCISTIDTVKFFIDEYDYNIQEPNNLKYYGDIKTGQVYKRIYNDDKIKITEKKIKGNIEGFFHNRLFLELSAPKIALNDDLGEFNGGLAENLYKDTKKHLELAGIALNGDISRISWVSRVDFCKTLRLKHKPSAYISKLQNYSLARHTRQVYDTETLFFRNKSNQMIFYDKLRELKNKYKKSDPFTSKAYDTLSTNNNYLRIEHRIQNKQKLRKLFDCKYRPNLEDTLNAYPELNESFLDTYGKITLNKDNRLTDIKYKNDLDLLKMLIETKRYGLKVFFEIEGFLSLMQRYNNDTNIIRQLLQDAGCDRMAWSRFYSKLSDCKKLMNYRDKDFDLIKEISDLVYSKAA